VGADEESRRLIHTTYQSCRRLLEQGGQLAATAAAAASSVARVRLRLGY
jgi:hypothetical protein